MNAAQGKRMMSLMKKRRKQLTRNTREERNRRDRSLQLVEEETGGRQRGGSRAKRGGARFNRSWGGPVVAPPHQGGRENVPFSLWREIGSSVEERVQSLAEAYTCPSKGIGSLTRCTIPPKQRESNAKRTDALTKRERERRASEK